MTTAGVMHFALHFCVGLDLKQRQRSKRFCRELCQLLRSLDLHHAAGTCRSHVVLVLKARGNGHVRVQVSCDGS